MSYALESKKEFARLQEQSHTEAYDLENELGILLKNKKLFKNASILDAGCGSGILARVLASNHPTCQITACDLSKMRLEQASAIKPSLHNIKYEEQNITELTYPSQSFDFAFTRYVMQHIHHEKTEKAMSELFRVLKPGGRIWLVDTDGVFFNLFPTPPRLDESLKKFSACQDVDMFVGRKLPSLLQKAGFTKIQWRIDTFNFTGESKKTEIKMIQDRFENGMNFFTRLFHSEKAAQTFKKDYLEALNHPESVLFYNKFIIAAQRPVPRGKNGKTD